MATATPAAIPAMALSTQVKSKDDDWLAGLIQLLTSIFQGSDKFGDAPALKPPVGEKGPPKVEGYVTIAGGKKEEIKEGTAQALRSTMVPSLLTPEERAKAAKLAKEIYSKEDTSASELLKEFAKSVGDEATELIKKMHEDHLSDPFEVPATYTPIDREERWVLEEEKTRDKEGEDNLLKLAQILRDKRVMFTDPYFPPNNTSIFADPATAGKNAGGKQTERFDQDPFLAGQDIKSIQWKRPIEIRPNLKPVVYSSSDANDSGIDPNDVEQGFLGNCYFLAAISSCAMGGTDYLVKDLCVEEGGDVGIYGVKFFVNGKWVTVVVDDLIPCLPDGRGGFNPMFAKPKQHEGQNKDEYELWAMIFEKAWAKLHLSYEVTDAGFTADTTNYLTGGTVTTIDLEWSAQEADAKGQWQEMMKYFKSQSTVSFLSCNVRPDVPVDPTTLMNQYGLVAGHAYSLLSLKHCRNGVRLVQIRNPWGRIEWKGAYSDKSSAWTPETKREAGHIDEEDGTFFMDFNDFCYFFGSVSICDPAAITRYTEDGHCRVDVFEGQWIRGQTAGGHCRLKTSPTFKHNPVCVLTVKHTGPVEVALYQPDPRPVETTTNTKLMSIELMLFEPETGKPPQRIIETRNRFGCYLIRRVEAGKKYHLIPCAWGAGVESTFWITASGQGCQLQAGPKTTPTAEEAKIMCMDNPRQECCTVCLDEDAVNYSADGLRCDAHTRSKVPESRYSKPRTRRGSTTVPGDAGGSTPAAVSEPQLEPPSCCAYCQKDIAGEMCFYGDKGPYHSPPCWGAPEKCYYCKHTCSSDFIKTQYGAMCGQDARRFGLI
eukprot:3941611-Rhodomonas_salina.2